MKYNILFTLNSSYFNYGKLLINSLYDNNDMSKVDTIFLADTGLNSKNKKYFKKYSHIKILNTNISSNFNEGGTWGKGWQTSVVSKTQSLYKILIDTTLPIIMIDADCMVIKDLSDLLLNDKDLQICYRKNESPDVPYLGSFVIVHNNPTSKQFVIDWINNIENHNSNRAKESPMLGKTIEESNVEVDNIPRLLVSCYNTKEYNDTVYVIHLKGGSLSKDINQDTNKRIYGTHGFDSLVKKYLHV